MCLRLARWFWNGKNEVELVVYFSSSVQICALIPVRFYSTCSKKKRELLACCYPGSYLPAVSFRPPPKVESSLISGPSCRKLCRCTQKKKKEKSLILFLQPAVWNFIQLGFKDLSFLCIFQFFFLLCTWAIRWSSATKAKKYTHSYIYLYTSIRVSKQLLNPF